MNIQNRFDFRRSTVTSHADHEPHLAVQPVLAHESLWLDSGAIPTQLQGDMVPLYRETTNGYAADEADDHACYNAMGLHTSSPIREGGAGVIRKRVRVHLAAGSFGEYVCVKTIVHENLDIDTATLYRPLLERVDIQGTRSVVADHLWQLDYAAGVIVLQQAGGESTDDLYLTYYEYVGRIGPTEAMLRPTTDLIREGEHNKYLSRPTVEAWARDVVTQLSTDDLKQGDSNLYRDSNTFDTDWRRRRSFDGITKGHHEGTVSGHVTGTVSSLDNHKVIRANIVGNGEGDWLGGMHGHSRGTFDGHASVSSGDMQNLSHVAIGGPAGDAPFTIHAATGAHIAMVSGTGCIAFLSARGDGSTYTSSLQSEMLRCQQLFSMGVDNAYGGIARVGDVSGIGHMRADTIRCDRLYAEAGVLVYYGDACTAKRCNVSNADGTLLGRLGDASASSSIHVSRLHDTLHFDIIDQDGDTRYRTTVLSGSENRLEVSDDGVRHFDD